MVKPDYDAAKSFAKNTLDLGAPHGAEGTCGYCNLSRAYLSLLEAVEPLLAAAEKATRGEWRIGFLDGSGCGEGNEGAWILTAEPFATASVIVEGGREAGVRSPGDAAFIVQARTTAAALRDLLGPTGGQA